MTEKTAEKQLIANLRKELINTKENSYIKSFLAYLAGEQLKELLESKRNSLDSETISALQNCIEKLSDISGLIVKFAKK
ncbi:hypothetical protein EFP49_09625 [Lactobacillus johnsonii]|uniref:hypothetical protein n=1 Tax=Lactobacillus johnsonii TaxID=33959 RepID=UPI0021A3E9DC|nr:hypothetical protein [Lactobacillus johnsonii]MCT3343002.1 hypothetical protein [Lactobacillus johnsonii]